MASPQSHGEPRTQPPEGEPTWLAELGGREATVVRPGDALVITFERRLSDAERFEVTERLKASLPGVRVVVIGEAKLALVPHMPESLATRGADGVPRLRATTTPSGWQLTQD